MADLITISGLVATPPRHVMTSDAIPITSFRLVSTQRRFDRATSTWIDGDSNWFTVSSFRQLALNTNSSIRKGDRVVVTGRLRIRDWESGERAGTTVEIEAESIGHDLLFGTSAFTRSPARQAVEAAPVTPEPTGVEVARAGEYPSATPAAFPPDTVTSDANANANAVAVPF